MSIPAPKRKPARLLRTLLTGMLAALPLLGTLWLLSIVVSFFVGWLGPESSTGRLLGKLGLGVAGQEWSGYLIGLLIAVVLLLALGALIERGLNTWLVWLVDAVVGRIPVVRTIYETIEKFVQIFARRERNELQSMRPVWCHFGGPGGVSALGLLSSPVPILVGGRACYAVIVPTAPVPIGGGLLFMPVEWIESTEIGMEAVTSIYVSMGLTAPQFLPSPKP
ncbi:MAG TPA: DUF502 domain-containing protein [Steroidobacteraceae bacterium]|nr:DUF502 domain-containing protein [Steroidobacteraceae bacterium]